MQNLNRETGYYWIKTEHDQWHIAHWDTSLGRYCWRVCWHKFSMYDQDFKEIDERKVVYDKQEIFNK